MSAELEFDFEGYVKLVGVNQIPEGEMIQVIFTFDGQEQEIGLAHTKGQIYAFRDVCPHMNFPLSIGYLTGNKLECRGHGWQFDLNTGKAINPPIKKTLEKFPLKIVDETIWVKLSNEAPV